MQRPVLVVAAVVAFAVGLAAAAGVEERVRVERVVWPVFVEPAGCTPRLEAVRVTEDGQSVTVTSFDRFPRPTLHALLIDASPSMLDAGRLDHAREAARGYIDRLRPDESVMLLTFDENLVMRAPATRMDSPDARPALDAALDAIGTGSLTLMRDALEPLILHVESYPERQVVVVLTDGHDALSRTTPGALLGTAASSPGQNLTIFTVGVRTSAGAVADRGFLDELARSTGGAFYEIATAEGIVGAFDDVRDRLDREAWLSWIPPRFGEGRRDPRKRDYALRRVRIADTDGDCTIVNPQRRRFVEREVDPPEPVDPSSGRMVLPTPIGRKADEAGEWYLEAYDGGLRGRVEDLVYEGGVLYRRGSEEPELVSPSKAVFALRDFHVFVPPAGSTEFERPEDVLRHWLVAGRPRPTASAGGARAIPASADTIHGSTFLQLREYLAEMLYRSFDTYREWVREPLGASIDRELRVRLPDLTPEARWSLVDARIENPRRAEIGRHLAVWLGDVTAADLAARLERRVLLELLQGGEPGREERLVELERVRAGWDAVRGWLAPPESVRVVTPLVLLHDRERDRVGFYRVVLPRPSFGWPPRDAVAATPRMLSAAAPLVDCPLPPGVVLDVQHDEGAVRFELGPSAAAAVSVSVRLQQGGGSAGPRCVDAWSGVESFDACYRDAGIAKCPEP